MANNRRRRVAKLRWQEKKAREKKIREKFATFNEMFEVIGVSFRSAVNAIRKALGANCTPEELKEKYIAMKLEERSDGDDTEV